MPLALSIPPSARRAGRGRSSSGTAAAAAAAAAHTAAASLCTPPLVGANWTHVRHCEGTAEAHEEWQLSVDLAQLDPDQVAQLCEGACLPIKFIEFLASSSEKKIVVTFLERAFLLEKHGEEVTRGFQSADIGCKSSQWVAWLFIGGSYTLLTQHADFKGSKLGLYFIPASGLGSWK